MDKGVDADEIDVPDEIGEQHLGRPARRRWIAGGAIAALVVAGGVAFAVARDDGADGADGASGDRSTPSAAPQGDLPAPDLDWRLVVGEVPAGFELQWINAPEARDGGFEEFGVAQRVQLLAGAGADLKDGPWLATTVQLLDRFERRNFDPMNYVDASQATGTRVGSYPGAFYDDPFAGTSTLLFGPVDDGYAVAISFAGIDRAEVSQLAAELTIDESSDTEAGRAVLGPAAAELGLEPLADFEASSWGFGGGVPIFSSLVGGSANGTSVTYESDIGGLTLTNSPLVAGLDPLVVGEFMLAGDEAVAVHGLPALVGEYSGFGFDINAVVWVEGGRSISLIGLLEPDALVAAAESVRVADRDEFDDLLRQVEQRQGGDIGVPEETWLLGMGDLEDSTTWYVEGDIDVDDGGTTLTICSGASGPSESSTSCGEASIDVQAPTLTDGPVVGLNVVYPTLIAMVDIDLEGAVLRFTSDDGTVTETALRIVRDDWPVRVMAIAIDRPGRAELIGADGTVLAERELTEEDIAVGGAAGPARPAPAGTAPVDTAGG